MAGWGTLPLQGLPSLKTGRQQDNMAVHRRSGQAKRKQFSPFFAHGALDVARPAMYSSLMTTCINNRSAASIQQEK